MCVNHQRLSCWLYLLTRIIVGLIVLPKDTLTSGQQARNQTCTTSVPQLPWYQGINTKQTERILSWNPIWQLSTHFPSSATSWSCSRIPSAFWLLVLEEPLHGIMDNPKSALSCCLWEGVSTCTTWHENRMEIAETSWQWTQEVSI